MSCNPELMRYLKKIYFLYGKEIPTEKNVVFSYSRFDNPHYEEFVAIPNPRSSGIVFLARDAGYIDFNEALDHGRWTHNGVLRQYTFTEKFIKEIMSGDS